ncbi:MAG TPA: DUF1697 domain-containing protein [Pyrinomonadaceae bacterium]|nr:DUF1697 domain-containing protein [Pyrinomonadaceae bacterium]
MSKQVALLRGVNVGTANRVAMADLRVLFEELGFRDVCTLLNSGNIVFSVPNNRRGDLLVRIEKALVAKLGLSSQVTVLSGDEVTAAVRDNPFADVATNPSSLLVVVPKRPSDQVRLRPLLKERWAPEMLALGQRVAYLWCARGLADSPLWTAVDRTLERSGTARNITTMAKLMALVEGPAK